MYQKKIEEQNRCPLEYFTGLLGGKWKFRIICVLTDQKEVRYQDIKKELVDISDSVLSAALKELAGAALVKRKSYDEVPPKIVYSLTEKGASVIPVMQAMCQWSSACYQGSTKLYLPRCQKCKYGARNGTH